MYFKIIRNILEMRVPSYAQDNNLSEEQVLLEIRQKMDHTSREYRSQNPQIDYGDPLCRLGYLYRHAAANATAVRTCSQQFKSVSELPATLESRT